MMSDGAKGFLLYHTVDVLLGLRIILHTINLKCPRYCGHGP